MKTPLQELMEWTHEPATPTSMSLREKIEQLMKKEKQVIMDAHKKGFFRKVTKREDEEEITRGDAELTHEAEQYYNETFNNE